MTIPLAPQGSLDTVSYSAKECPEGTTVTGIRWECHGARVTMAVGETEGLGSLKHILSSTPYVNKTGV